jgi:hypothetical protein
MDCRDCHRHDPEAGACLDRKLNPQSWSQAVEVANVFGIRSVCVYNDHRERLVAARGVAVGRPGAQRPAP